MNTKNLLNYELVFGKVMEAAKSGRDFYKSYQDINTLGGMTHEIEAAAAEYGMLVAMQALGEVWGAREDGWPSKEAAQSVFRNRLNGC